jgi:beta-N-acetylhexosaminidase
MKRILSLSLTLFMLCSLTACNFANTEPVQTTAEVTTEPATDPAEADNAKLDEMVAKMTNEERVGQLFFVRCPDENAVQTVSDYHIGGYILF